MNIKDLIQKLADYEGASESGSLGTEQFAAACRRMDDDPREQQRIGEIADMLDMEESIHDDDFAVQDRDGQDAALLRERRVARAPVPGSTSITGSSSHRQPAVQATARPRGNSGAASSVVNAGEWLALPCRDMRGMNRSERDEARARVAQLREFLRSCPADVLGTEASAVVLTGVAAWSEALIADRDERAALRLIRAAFPHLMLLGRRHPAVLGARRACAAALCELGHYTQAERLVRQLGEDERQVFGADDPQTALLMLWVLVRSGQLPEAETGFSAIRARLTQLPVADTQIMWHLHCKRSWLLGQQGLESESASCYDSVIFNRSCDLGHDHPDALDARHSKGKMLVSAGDGSSAAKLLRAVADDRARVQGDRHPDTLETLKYLDLANVQAEPRDDRILDHAIDSLEEILHVQDKRHGPDYPVSRDTAAQLGGLLHLREAVRSREPIPILRQVPVPVP